MVNRLKIVLEQAEYAALLELSLASLRTPEAQARFILQQALEKQGFPKKSQDTQNKEGQSYGKSTYF